MKKEGSPVLPSVMILEEVAITLRLRRSPSPYLSVGEEPGPT
jgi:hypothetical protein